MDKVVFFNRQLAEEGEWVWDTWEDTWEESIQAEEIIEQEPAEWSTWI